MNATLNVCAIDRDSEERARAFAKENSFTFSQDGVSDFALAFSRLDVRLLDLRKGKPVVVAVDFTAGASVHRMRFGGGKGQAIAKAVGITAQIKPRVLDATAGLGRDAFVLASLGSEVLLLERSPVAHVLLENGLSRAKIFSDENNTHEYLQLRETIQRMTLIKKDSHGYLNSLGAESVNVVYLDPMFPERKKSAQVKKEMRAFQMLVGSDVDADALLGLALKVSENRVVVKRPIHAPFLAKQTPSHQLKGKSSRFDIYAKKSLGMR